MESYIGLETLEANDIFGALVAELQALRSEKLPRLI